MTTLNEKKDDKDFPDQLASLLVKVSQDVLLLPNVSVAEIINFGNVKELIDKPDWYIGDINWRDLELPLISYEGMKGQGISKPKDSSRIIILNGIKGNKLLPFYGLVSQGIPRLSRVSPREIDQEEKSGDHTDFISLSLNGESVTIPDLENIEQMLIDAL